MNLLDAKTVIFSYVISNALSAMVIFLLWRENRRRFAGLGFWLADFVMQFVALLVVARGVVPNFVSMTVSNALIIGGTILLYMGLERYVGKRSAPAYNVILLALFIPLHSYFVFVHPNLNARTIILSAGILVLCYQCARLMLRRVDEKLRPITHGLGMVFAGYCLVSIARIVVNLAFRSDNNLFNSNLLDASLVMMDQMLFILLTFNLFLMVNRRLVVDLENDTAERRRAEAAIASLAKFPDENPNPILRVDGNGIVLYANSSASLLLQSLDSAVDRPAPASWQVWVTQTLEKQVGQTVEMEHAGRVYTCEVVPIREGGYVNLYVHDITERKQVEAIIQVRLQLFEFAATHSLDELMQKALDEIGRITSSPIGFYHFVEPDQKTLSLQAWSTRTLEEFCHAEGKGMHYDLDQAGVWVDCVRQRKPVIHNNYTALSHRKGMPDGHAEVVREVVVPTLRKGKIVSILGVGNKPSDYDEKDIELVSYIADVVWGIVERKRTEEEIQLLQAELREQVIRDPLTGLYNRRFLNETLGRELARAAREQYPVSFVMIDIDHFKRINDAFGHNAGDAILQKLASQLLSQTRVGDIICRYGGEEFLAVLPNVTAEKAMQISERWRNLFLGSTLLLKYSDAKATISCGISEFPTHGKTDQELISIADNAMYHAKATGRNRVVIWRTDPKE